MITILLLFIPIAFATLLGYLLWHGLDKPCWWPDDVDYDGPPRAHFSIGSTATTREEGGTRIIASVSLHEVTASGAELERMREQWNYRWGGRRWRVWR